MIHVKHKHVTTHDETEYYFINIIHLYSFGWNLKMNTWQRKYLWASVSAFMINAAVKRCKQTDKQTNKQTNRQTDRQTFKQTNQTNRQPTFESFVPSILSNIHHKLGLFCLLQCHRTGCKVLLRRRTNQPSLKNGGFLWKILSISAGILLKQLCIHVIHCIYARFILPYQL